MAPRRKPNADARTSRGHNEAIVEHLERHIGPVEFIYHEDESVHIDICIVGPSPGRDFYTLVTWGMSDRPMNAPAVIGEARAELMLCVPADRPFGHRFEDKAHAYPAMQLLTLARHPHKTNSFLWYGASMSNGDPPRPSSAGEPFCGTFLMPPATLNEEQCFIDIGNGRIAHMIAIVPLFLEELSLKLSLGAERFYELLKRGGVTELLDYQRPRIALGPAGPGDVPGR